MLEFLNVIKTFIRTLLTGKTGFTTTPWFYHGVLLNSVQELIEIEA